MRELKRELWPVKVALDINKEHDIMAMELWMGEKFGTFKGRWNFVQHWKGTDVYFRNEQDALMFSLRWAK
jgi:hypothetical protein